MYIGKIPATGAFQKCDALSASGTADYTLQVGSTNVVPESVNHMIVSLNGVIQAPTTAYTVAGSTLSFASSLTSSDSIDFILLLGNVLDVGVPSDDTVGAAQIKDDLISGTTALASEPADTDEFLVSDAGTLKRIDYSLIKGGGITEADQWRLHTNLTPSGTSLEIITANLERVDGTGQDKMGTGMSESSGVFTFPSTGYWLVRASIQFQDDGTTARYLQNYIQVTVNNADYTTVTEGSGNISSGSGSTYEQVPAQTLIDVTNTTNVKVKFAFLVATTSGSMKLYASSTTNRTYFTFIRLGDP